MNDGAQISIVDLDICFKKLRNVSATKNIYHNIEHPALPGQFIEFVSSADYLNGRYIWKLNEPMEIVSGYE